MTSLFSRPFELSQRFVIPRGSRRIDQIVRLHEQEFLTSIAARSKGSRCPDVGWVQAHLAGMPMEFPPATATLRSVDLFCGSGGLTTGLKLGARSVGMRVDTALAADADLQALEIFRANHGPVLTFGDDVQKLVNYVVDGQGQDATWSTWPVFLDPHMAGFLADLDVLVAGPPCQGHSNLNNRTRRKDARNLLYLTTVAFAVAANVKLCIIENVPDVLNDAHDVVRTARALLVKSGYRIDDTVLSADDFGVPQRRRRHFLIAVRNSQFEFDLASMVNGLKVSQVNVKQAIGDLAKLKGDDVLNTTSVLSPDNIRRINWLHDHDEDVLPDRLRPDCHKGGHTYPSVYGRMRSDEPAQTITTGFLTPGRGRYVHPTERRTITPREAARLQSFPDSYEFVPSGGTPTRAVLSKVIGDAVPPLLARAVSIAGLALLTGVPRV